MVSLSARRAWIEIKSHLKVAEMVLNVALRKESVDRNRSIALPMQTRCKSLSARRAWIEIRTPA